MKTWKYAGVLAAIAVLILLGLFCLTNGTSSPKTLLGRLSAVRSFFSSDSGATIISEAPRTTTPKVNGAAVTQTTKNVSPALAAAMTANSAADLSGRNRPAYLGGEEASATVRVGDKVYNLVPNQGGDFGRVYMGAKDKTTVTVSYPKTAAESPVVVQAQDGGTVYMSTGDASDKGAIAQVSQLDGTGQVSFTFQSGDQDGIYRVSLRQGADLKQIDFWVGNPLPVRQLTDAGN